MDFMSRRVSDRLTAGVELYEKGGGLSSVRSFI
jgi:hypothetical protein